MASSSSSSQWRTGGPARPGELVQAMVPSTATHSSRIRPPDASGEGQGRAATPQLSSGLRTVTPGVFSTWV